MNARARRLGVAVFVAVALLIGLAGYLVLTNPPAASAAAERRLKSAIRKARSLLVLHADLDDNIQVAGVVTNPADLAELADRIRLTSRFENGTVSAFDWTEVYAIGPKHVESFQLYGNTYGAVWPTRESSEPKLVRFDERFGSELDRLLAAKADAAP